MFHRSYIALDEKGRFGLFAEMELSFATGENNFSYKSGEDFKFTNSENMTVKVWFNPGVAVYAFPNVCATLSFGLGGFKYASTRQFDEQGAPGGVAPLFEDELPAQPGRYSFRHDGALVEQKERRARMKRLNRNLWRLASCVAAIFVSGCIENDIPYPVVVCNIESISARGFRAIRS